MSLAWQLQVANLIVNLCCMRECDCAFMENEEPTKYLLVKYYYYYYCYEKLNSKIENFKLILTMY